MIVLLLLLILHLFSSVGNVAVTGVKDFGIIVSVVDDDCELAVAEAVSVSVVDNDCALVVAVVVSDSVGADGWG
jgi:hypothetical protein